MLNKNINKIRRIAKAQSGLSVPSGNPYMTTNGLAIPGNSITQQNLLGRDYGAEFRSSAEQIMAPVNNLIDFNAKMGDLFSLKLQNDRNYSRAMAQMNTKRITTPKDTSPSLEQLFQRLGGWNKAGQAVDLANSLLFSKQRSKDSAATTGLNNLWNAGSKIVSSFNPALGFAMGTGNLVANTARSLGTGTDQQTGFDKFGDSTIGQLSGIGFINGALDRKTRGFSADKETIEQVGGSYGGTVRNINEASEKAGKEYGLFSSRKRKQANRFIDKTESQQLTMANIAENASDLSSIAANMSDLNHMQYGFNLNGGYDQRYMRAAKFGAKLKRVKKINFRKQGGEIVGAINLDNWQPVITEAVEQFENGGELEWTPVITEYKQGGKSEGPSKKESELEETNQKNIIPEGALHAHKHHMENADNLTKKGIPVIDNDGEQQAEIEKNEIIFTLEVTKKLEELYSKYQDYEYSQKEKDEVAIEAGKILVEEILFNTDDRTGLINTLQKGGKINEIE